jgi:hypothetical protein
MNGLQDLTKRAMVRLLVWGFFASLSALAVVRGLSLQADSGRPSAHQEQRWMPWAWSAPEAKPILREIRKVLRPGEKVVILLHPERVQTAYCWEALARYLWTENTDIEVASIKEYQPTTESIARAHIYPSGRWSLHREGGSRP